MTPILLLAEAYTEPEERHSAALIGSSGVLLLQLLAEADVIRPQYAKYWVYP